MSVFERSVTCSFFSRDCTHILKRTQGEKFEYMFLVKIASKETSITLGSAGQLTPYSRNGIRSNDKHLS